MSNANQTTSERILAIRAEAGARHERCPICSRPPGAPYRRRAMDGSRYTEGCVDAIHEGHLEGESKAWHDRPEAQAMRTKTLVWLASL